MDKQQLKAKALEITGKGSHAGLAPDQGIHALEAALCGMNNINALRDTFPVEETALVHYIIIKGGDSPNIIPDDVRMEVGVRASSVAYMMELSEKVNRAIRAGAEAIGAQVDGKVKKIVLQPTELCFRMGKEMKGLPRVADAETSQWIYNRMMELSRPYGTELTMDGNQIVLTL